MKKQTNVLILLALMVVIIAGLGQWFLSQRTNLNVSTGEQQSVLPLDTDNSSLTGAQKKAGGIQVSLDFSDGKPLSANVDAVNAYTALEALAKLNNLAIQVKEYKYGRMVERIGEKVNSSSFFWGYSVNGKMGQVAGDKFLVHPGDTVEWKYTKIKK